MEGRHTNAGGRDHVMMFRANSRMDGGGGADRLTHVLGGTGGASEIFGRSGNDLLQGGGENDMLIGGGGYDKGRGAGGIDRCATEVRVECER